ncbi:MAG TPA: glycosyltransferase [Bordetella sp.]|nr:glycosyltransferase [Bordetella sp.]
MRVTHIFKTFAPDTYGGIEHVVHTLASHTALLGVQNKVVVLTPGKPRREALEHYELVRYKRDLNLASTGFSLGLFRHFRRELADTDLLHLHFPWPFADLCYLAQGAGIPAVVTYHSDVVNQVRLNKLYAPLRDRMLARVIRIVVTAPGMIESSPVLHRWRDKIDMIPLGIERLVSAPSDEARAREFHERFGPRFFLFLGVLRYYKGLHTLLDALKGRDYPVVLAGDGPELSTLRLKAQQLGLHNVHFLGAVSEDDKRVLLKAAYGFVFPSHLRSEAFGLALVEAAQQGTPMISCEIGTGTSFVNAHGETGLVVAPEQPRALGAALDRFWNEPEQVRQWGQHAYRRYETRFTAARMAGSYLECYERVLANQARRQASA